MTTVLSLVERVRDAFSDYGDGQVALEAPVLDITDRDFVVDTVVGLESGQWLTIGYETVYVVSAAEGPPATITVRRGQRGSTSANHEAGDICYVNLTLGNHTVLNALNSALARLTKQVMDDSIEVLDEEAEYDVPIEMGTVDRVDVEVPGYPGRFTPIRTWELTDNNTFRLYGGYAPGQKVRLVGRSSFSVMEPDGDLDEDFPDDSLAAVSYLIAHATATLQLQVQTYISKRDSFVGITDSFSITQPDHSARISRYLLAEAERYRREAIATCPILQGPVAPTKHPGRGYLG